MSLNHGKKGDIAKVSQATSEKSIQFILFLQPTNICLFSTKCKPGDDISLSPR